MQFVNAPGEISEPRISEPQKLRNPLMFIRIKSPVSTPVRQARKPIKKLGARVRGSTYES